MAEPEGAAAAFAVDVVRRHDPADRAAVLEPLVAFDEARKPSDAREPLAILVRDGSGAVVGGLSGRFATTG